MRRHCSPHPSWLPADPASSSRRWVRPVALCFLAAAMLPSLRAQQQDDPPPPPNLYTLHVYTNLMQFPTIVLGPDLKPIPPVPRDKFAITIDGGPVFHPTKMRIEGDDPISLAVLLDASGPQNRTLQEFAKAFPQLSAGALHAEDRVSIYAVDCKVMRSVKSEPAVDADIIARGIDSVLSGQGLHGTKNKPACGYSLHLWDAVRMVAQDMDGSHRRRVLLVVSLGRETGSKSSLATASDDLSSKGISFFALRDSDEYRSEMMLSQFGAPMMRTHISGPFGGLSNDEDLLATMCARNGGLVLDALNPGVAQDLQHLVELLRGRYIIEYPRPDDTKPATHALDITIPGVQAFIRPTGGSSPIPDPAILADPTTLPSTPSPAQVGKRRRPKQ